MKAPTNDSQRKVAVMIGKACLRAQLAVANPGMEADKLRAKIADKWNDDRHTYVKLGGAIVRSLERAGYALTPSPGSAPRAPAKGKG